jgi:hypothetical protein
MRLVDQALELWMAFRRVQEKERLRVPPEIPMQFFAHAVEIALETNMHMDAPDFIFKPAMWDFAVRESLYAEAVRELYLGMPATVGDTPKL